MSSIYGPSFSDVYFIYTGGPDTIWNSKLFSKKGSSCVIYPNFIIRAPTHGILLIPLPKIYSVLPSKWCVLFLIYPASPSCAFQSGVGILTFFLVAVITPLASCEIVSINETAFPFAVGEDTALCTTLYVKSEPNNSHLVPLNTNSFVVVLSSTFSS